MVIVSLAIWMASYAVSESFHTLSLLLQLPAFLQCGIHLCFSQQMQGGEKR